MSCELIPKDRDYGRIVSDIHALVLYNIQSLQQWGGTATRAANLKEAAVEHGAGSSRFAHSGWLLLPLVVVVVFSSCSTPNRGAIRENSKDGLRYVWVPGGGFQAGCSKFDAHCEADEKPAHDITLSKGFWIGQTEVTVGAYRRFADATHRGMPPAATFGDQKLNPDWANPRMPIVNVDWNDSKAYCQWMGGDLPSEAQWEYAARGTGTMSTYGSLPEITWFADNAGANLIDSTKLLKENEPGFLFQLSLNHNSFHELGLKAPNQYMLYDMLGNVWEWTADWYGAAYYSGAERSDPHGPPNGDARVLRGGSWTNIPSAIRVSVRGRRTPTTRSVDAGFRCIW